MVDSSTEVVPGDDEEYFLNVPDVFWFCVSEITTVGNASKSPATVMGQALAIVLACFGVFYLSFAQAVIVNSFQEVRFTLPGSDVAALQDSFPVSII